MPTRLGTAYIPVEGDWSRFNRQLSSEGRKLDKTFRDRGLHAGKLLAGGLATAGAAGLAAIAVEGKRAFEAFQESNKIAKQTDAVLKSTGGVANVTARSVSRLATAISRKTGVDDEAIQSGENLLLTFTNVRNEAGKGNRIFDRATKTITDMSVALGQDTKSSAIQLGKALNDPVKGITALSRVGVSFTQQQKDQIQALVESGDTLAAQKVILGELTKEFGGSAAAQATATDKMKVSIGNLEEGIGRGLAPAVDAVATKITRLAQDVEPDLLRVTDKIGRIFGRKDLDLAGKIKLSTGEVRQVLSPLLEEGRGIVGKMHLDEKLGAAIEKGAPLVANALAEAAPEAASRFVRAFANANVWGQLVIGGLLLKKMGGLAAFTALGRKAGGAMGAGMATGAAAGGAAGGAGGAAAGAAAGAAGAAASRAPKLPGSLRAAGGTAAGLAAIKIGSDFVRGYAKADAAVKVFQDRVKKLADEGNRAGLRKLAEEIRHYADINQGAFSDSGKAARQYADAVEHALDRPTKALQGAGRDFASVRRDINANWGLLNQRAKASLEDIRSNVRTNMGLIRDRLDKDSAAGHRAVLHNFRLAAKSIRHQMDAGVISVKEGSHQIHEYLRKIGRLTGLTQVRLDAIRKTGTLLNSEDRPGRSTVLRTPPPRKRGASATDDEDDEKDAKRKKTPRRAPRPVAAAGGDVDTMNVKRLIVDHADGITGGRSRARGAGASGGAGGSAAERAARNRMKTLHAHDVATARARQRQLNDQRALANSIGTLAKTDENGLQLFSPSRLGRLASAALPARARGAGAAVSAPDRSRGDTHVHQELHFHIDGMGDDQHLTTKIAREVEKRAKHALARDVERRGSR